MKAAILAAGAAPPLGADADVPKPLLAVGGVPILRRAMTSLLRAGFDQFVIGAGHLEDLVRAEVARWFPGLEVAFVTNPEFHATNNAATLLRLREHLEGDAFLLLDGDVVFDPGVVEELVERGPDALAIRSVGALGLEEVKVTADVHDRLLAIGKHVPVRSAMGESVGIALFGAATSRRLFAILDQRVRERGLVHEYYEAALQQLLDEGVTLYGVDIGSRYASEIDTMDDLTAVNRHLAQGPAFDVRVGAVRLAV